MSLFPVSLLITLAALVAVLALAWFALKALSRFNLHQQSNSPVRVLHSVNVGSRERLVLVQYGGSEFLVGVSAGGITTLDKQPVTDSASGPEKPAIPGK